MLRSLVLRKKRTGPAACGCHGGVATENNTAALSKTMLLVGNPNVGKSVLFKNLTNRYVTVSNFPGTTVEIVRARTNIGSDSVEVIDTPGVNDLAPRSEDARVTAKVLDQYQDAVVVQVADAKNLRRALLLTLQLATLHRPMILVLNMLDELEKRGGSIDLERLSALLGVPVVGTVAVRNQGTEELIRALPAARPPTVNGAAKEQQNHNYESNRERLARVKEIVSQTYTISQPDRASLQVRLGFWAMHPVKGLAFLGVVLLAVFWFVGLFGAGTLVDMAETAVFKQRIGPLVIGAVDATLPFPHIHDTEVVTYSLSVPITPVDEIAIGSVIKDVVVPGYTIEPNTNLSWLQRTLQFVHDFFVGEYGAITMALSYAFAIVLPIVTTFFLVFSVLEDSGYFSRMAIMVNRIFRPMGLNGKAVLPMILGLGCDTMATMTTRILETRRERVVTTMLLALAVPCSAQLGVLLAMMSMLSPVGAAVWVGLVVGIMFSVGWLTSRLFKGDTSEFILEIPPMRRPQISNVLVKTVSRLNWYIKEVIPIFVLGTALLFILDKLHILGKISRLGEPLVVGWLGLPSDMANAFLVGFMRRDFGAVYILDAAIGPNAVLTSHQVLVAMVTITLFMPCIANFLMISKEQGQKMAWRMAGFIFPFAFFVGGLVNWIGRWIANI